MKTQLYPLLVLTVINGYGGEKSAEDENNENNDNLGSELDSGCGINLLVVDKDKIEAEMPFDDWVNAEDVRLCKDPIPMATTINPALVNLNHWKDRKKQALWLAKNERFFCIPDSYKYIHDSHLIKLIDSDIIDQIQADTTNGMTISLQQLIDGGINLKPESYHEYAIFAIDAAGLKYKMATYNENETCYSVAFLNSIINEGNVTDFKSCMFKFAKVKLVNSPPLETIAFSVSIGSALLVKYYDYSTKPGGGVM